MRLRERREYRPRVLVLSAEVDWSLDDARPRGRYSALTRSTLDRTLRYSLRERMADEGTFIGEVQRGWQRFWRLSWWWKGPSLGGVALLALIIIGVATGGGGDDNKSAAEKPTATASPTTATPRSATATATATTTVTATVAPTTAPTAVPTVPPTVPPTQPPPPPPTIAPTQPPAYDYACEANASCNCSDFPTHAEAQRIFEKHGGSPAYNWAGLDH